MSFLHSEALQLKYPSSSVTPLLHQCHLQQLPCFADSRGNLSVIESSIHIPFTIERIYYLYGDLVGGIRGLHAHRKLQQMIIPISGSFCVTLDDSLDQKDYFLHSPSVGLYVCPMIWRKVHSFSDNAVCLVIASRPYEPDDYIFDYGEYCELRQVACLNPDLP